MAPAPATRAGPALAAVPVTPASGSRGERKGTRARGKAGGHADFRQHSSCCLCYTTQPGKYTSRTAGVPRCLFPHLTARLQPVQPAEVQQHGCGCGGQRGSPVPQEQREVCHRHCCTRAVDAASPALLTAQAVSSSLEAAPGQLSSSWAACGTATATARKAEEQVAVSKGSWRGRCFCSSALPAMPVCQGYPLWDVELAGNLLLKHSLLKNSKNLLKI